MQVNYHSSINDIPAETWNGLFASDNPFIQHAFLLALEKSGCVNAGTGWQAQHLTLVDHEQVLAVMPLFVKHHSYGEFVFDWGWADAYKHHGLNYYPKLVTAVPFSPVTGPRLGISGQADPDHVLEIVIKAIQHLAVTRECSGWHLLFPDVQLRKALHQIQDKDAVLYREAVQFQWRNQDYRNFDEFLAALKSSRRKTIRRERRRVREQGISLHRKLGAQISDEEWQNFYQCYMNTYRKRSGHDGYLNADFFNRLRKTMTSRLMLVTAQCSEVIIASSLFLYDSHRLYGRYWGALQDVSCLHFEACFYQGIEFCIEQGLQVFDPGTQGEHKLMRGFAPCKSISCHWISDGRFRQAIAEFLEHEKIGTNEYCQRAETYLPYKKEIL